jgi:hypothetical protein
MKFAEVTALNPAQVFGDADPRAANFIQRFASSPSRPYCAGARFRVGKTVQLFWTRSIVLPSCAAAFRIEGTGLQLNFLTISHYLAENYYVILTNSSSFEDFASFSSVRSRDRDRARRKERNPRALKLANSAGINRLSVRRKRAHVERGEKLVQSSSKRRPAESPRLDASVADAHSWRNKLGTRGGRSRTARWFLASATTVGRRAQSSCYRLLQRTGLFLLDGF